MKRMNQVGVFRVSGILLGVVSLLATHAFASDSTCPGISGSALDQVKTTEVAAASSDDDSSSEKPVKPHTSSGSAEGGAHRGPPPEGMQDGMPSGPPPGGRGPGGF
jgi:hypothetical protein